MRCPFLEETWVRYCELEPRRRIPLASPASPVEDRCASHQWRECPLAQEEARTRPDSPRCPHYRTTKVQWCSASAVAQQIPYNDSLLSRCQSESYHWCPLYRERECPDRAKGASPLPPRGRMWHSLNHMWMHEGEFGLCHVGLDEFATQLIGEPDALHYAQSHGIGRPQVVVRLDDTELAFVFPERVEILIGNTHLTRDRRALPRDPYGAGWLFEARRLRLTERPTEEERLLEPDEYAEWNRIEQRRLLETVHAQVIARDPATAGLAADGGELRPGLLRQLGSELRREIHREFFDVSTRERA